MGEGGGGVSMIQSVVNTEVSFYKSVICSK